MLGEFPYQSLQGMMDSFARCMISAFFLLSSPAAPPVNGIYPATRDHEPPAWFVDVADAAGIRMTDVNGGVKSKRYIIESTGSGVAILDYDNDGWPDIFFRQRHYAGRFIWRALFETNQSPLSQQARWHVYRCNGARRPIGYNLGAGCVRRRLRQ